MTDNQAIDTAQRTRDMLTGAEIALLCVVEHLKAEKPHTTITAQKLVNKGIEDACKKRMTALLEMEQGL